MDRTFLALVTFERTERETEHLPPEALGACGYMAVLAKDEAALRDVLSAGLEHEGLRLREIDQIEEFDIDDTFPINDEHLRSNITEWEPGTRWVWGTIHIYLAEGEA